MNIPANNPLALIDFKMFSAVKGLKDPAVTIPPHILFSRINPIKVVLMASCCIIQTSSYTQLVELDFIDKCNKLPDYEYDTITCTHTTIDPDPSDGI